MQTSEIMSVIGLKICVLMKHTEVEAQKKQNIPKKQQFVTSSPLKTRNGLIPCNPVGEDR